MIHSLVTQVCSSSTSVSVITADNSCLKKKTGPQPGSVNPTMTSRAFPDPEPLISSKQIIPLKALTLHLYVQQKACTSSHDHQNIQHCLLESRGESQQRLLLGITSSYRTDHGSRPFGCSVTLRSRR